MHFSNQIWFAHTSFVGGGGLSNYMTDSFSELKCVRACISFENMRTFHCCVQFPSQHYCSLYLYLYLPVSLHAVMFLLHLFCLHLHSSIYNMVALYVKRSLWWNIKHSNLLWQHMIGEHMHIIVCMQCTMYMHNKQTGKMMHDVLELWCFWANFSFGLWI